MRDERVFRLSLQDLANKENELYTIVLGMNGRMEDIEKELRTEGVFKKYYQIHAQYVKLAENDLEALK